MIFQAPSLTAIRARISTISFVLGYHDFANPEGIEFLDDYCMDSVNISTKAVALIC
jgi:hypothetical protein